jgi:protein-S-isoprenylcysteine O-methyltransferase Ste14
MTVYVALIGVCWLVFMIAWAISALVFRNTGRRYYSPRATGLRLLFAVAVFLAIGNPGIVAFQPFGELFRLDFAAAAGAALCIVGLAFAIWARIALGSNWGMPMTQHENPKLVTSGPYRFVRHPIYTGLSAMMIGTALVYPRAALPCLAVVGYTVFSARREERDMAQRFPAAYPDYRKRSKMLVPFLF